MDRREFMQLGIVTAGTLSAWQRSAHAWQADKPLRVALIGCGWYGKTDLLHMIQVAPVEVVGLCDVDARCLADAAQLVAQRQASQKQPPTFADYRELLKQQAALSNEFADFLAQAAAKGEGSPLDAGQAKLEAASQTLEIRALDAEEVAAVGTLKPLLGMRPDESLHVGGSLPDANLPGSAVEPSKRPDFQAAVLGAKAAGQGVAVEELEDLRLSAADAEQQDALVQAGGENGRTVLQLFADIVAAVRDGFEPTIGFLGHGWRRGNIEHPRLNMERPSAEVRARQLCLVPGCRESCAACWMFPPRFIAAIPSAAPRRWSPRRRAGGA